MNDLPKPMVRMIVVLLKFSLIFQFGCNKSSNISQPYIEPNCPKLVINGQNVRGDLVHSRITASIIGEKVIEDFNSVENAASSSGAEVSDLGKNWEITEVLRKSTYGGGLEFQIDKCTGEISNMKIYRD